MVIFFLLPVIAAVIGLIICFIGFIGICLIIIGSTGIAMNKIYLKQMKTENTVSKPLFNKISIILGIIFLVVPLVYVLFEIIFTLAEK